MDKPAGELSVEKLKQKLSELKESLADFEETNAFYLSNSAAHISQSQVVEYEEGRKDYIEQISEVERLLEEKEN